MKLISSFSVVVMLNQGYELCEEDEASHFCNVKKRGEEFKVYLRKT